VSSSRINPSTDPDSLLPIYLQQSRFQGTAYPYIVVRCLVPKEINYELSPVPYQGNVVARVKLVWRTLIRNAFFLNPPSPFSSIYLHLSKTSFLKTFHWNRALFQGFRKHFQIPKLSVPNLEFLLHYKVFQRS
jgi:hypothetical protein